VRLVRDVSHYEGPVITVLPDAPVAEIADKMDRFAVGSIVVVDDARGPLGIVTDRDLLRRVVAPGRDPEKIRASDVMSSELVTCATQDPLERVLDAMRSRAVRRIPVLRDGKVAGLVALDDVVAELGRELSDLRDAIRGEVLGARSSAARRRRREQIEGAVEELRASIGEIGQQTRDWLARETEALRDLIRRSGS
jgi:CBS domain-containing protein